MMKVKIDKNYSMMVSLFSLFILLFSFAIFSCDNPLIQRIVEPKTATFESNGGSSVESQTVFKGQPVRKPSNPSRDGFAFGAWYSDNETFQDEWDFSVIPNRDITLYAKWEPIPVSTQYTVTFNADGGTPAPETQTIEHGGKVSEPAAMTKTDFIFGGWYRDAECTDGNEWDFETDTVTADITLYAKWVFNGDPVIRIADITVISPIANAAPNNTASGAGSFTIGAVSWSPDDNLFQGGVEYTAAVTLTAHQYYAFAETSELDSATINGNDAAVIDNTGNSLVLSYTFPPTRIAVSMEISTQPKLSYTHGDTLDLSELAVRVIYNDGTEDIALSDFASSGITVSPAHGTVLSHSTHNNTQVTVSIGGFTADTNALTVNKAVPALTWPSARTITYGAALSTSTLTGGSTIGTWAWEDPTIIPTVENNGYTVVFTPSDTENYDWTGVTLTRTVAITVNSASITSAAITVTAPAKNGTPVTTANGTGNFTVSEVTWSPAAATFTVGTQYTVRITLTANTNYTFASTLTPRTINGNSATASNNTGATVTLSYQFPAVPDPDAPTWTAVTNTTFDYSTSSTTGNLWTIAYANNRFVAGGGSGSSPNISGRMAYSDNGAEWAPLPDGTIDTTITGYIYAIAYGGGKWVAASFHPSNQIAYSTDGENWTAAANNTIWNYTLGSSTQTAPINAIAYGGGRFIAVGGYGKMASSTDGANWTAVTNSTFGTSQISAIAYANNRWVAGGDGGKMAYSADGLNWTAVENTTLEINGIAYGGGTWVAVSYWSEYKMAYSTDNGVNWTAVADSTFDWDSFNAIAYGDSKFIAVGSGGRMAYSTDGISWTAIEGTANTFGLGGIYAIAYGGGRFVAVGAGVGGIGHMAYSGNYVAPPPNHAVTFNSNGGSTVPSQTVASGSTITAPANPSRSGYTFGGWYKESALTTPWNFQTDTVSADITLYAKWNINTYTVTFNSGGGSTVSPLTNVTHGSTITAPAEPSRSGYTFVGWYKESALTTPWNFTTDTVTANITLYAKWVEVPVTPTGPTWTAVTNSTFGTSSNSISAIAYGGGRFVAGGESGKMAYSTDGSSWTAVSSTNSTFGTSQIYAIAYGNNTWVAVGYSGKMAYSTNNGSSWTAVSDSTFDSSIIYSIAYGNGTFVAGGTGQMAYSTNNGVTWTSISATDSTFGTSQIYAITYSNGRFVAVGNSGKMAYSADGVTWTAVSNSTFSVAQIRGIAYGSDVNTWVAVGMASRIAYSTNNGVTWTAVSNSIFGTSQIYAIAYGSDGNAVNRFVAVGGSGTMAYSADGINWTAVADSTFGTIQINAIAYANGRFVAVGNSGRMAYSGDYVAPPAPTYQLGDTGPGGGKIFYVSEAGFTVQMPNASDNYTAHYLEAAPTDMASIIAWASSAFLPPSAGGTGTSWTDIPGTGTAIGIGRKNTAVILAIDAAAPAAKACNDYSNGGKTDWFLPSQDELYQLYVNRTLFNNLTISNIFGYWSSTQQSNANAFVKNFETEGWGNGSKGSTFYVRPIRAF